jgi:hypothetical protein
MSEYHKIQSVFKRDMKTKRLILNDWTLAEFEYLANNEWEFTEKVDGTNIRVEFKDGAVTFGGRTDNAQIPAQLVERLNNRFMPSEKRQLMAQVFADSNFVVLYGEGYGAKIQKGGGNYRPDQDFVLFDVRVGSWWLKRDAVMDVGQKLGLDVVPIVGEGTLYEAIELTRNGFKSTWGDFQAEGIVARPKVELFTRNMHRLITKIKCRDFNND